MPNKMNGTVAGDLPATVADLRGAAREGTLVTLLVVDDEPGILCALRWMLRTDKFTLIEASTGAEAVCVAAGRDRPIDLMLTDVDMPGMGGVEVARAVRALRPEMPVLFMSGVRAIARGSRPPEMDEAHFIEKPFTSAELLAKIRGLIAV